jgi:hypothetical protein
MEAALNAFPEKQVEPPPPNPSTNYDDILNLIN